MSPADRDRSQLVVALGEGQDGQRARELIDQSAKLAGKTVSSWARETLLKASGSAESEGLDPIVELEMRVSGDVGFPGPHYLKVSIDLLGVFGMRVVEKGPADKLPSVEAFIGNDWTRFFCSDPNALMERWKRVKRAA